MEKLSGIITTNHDGLLQVASQRVFNGISVGYSFHSSDYEQRDSAPPILQLHGSFTWQFGTPIRVATLKSSRNYVGTVWIPPTILKESKNFPFNKLAGLAYELLARQCDVLRVIGASLTQNDWNILSLIFNAQRHREARRGTPFQIELIMPQEAGERLKDECAYLKNVKPIGYLTDGQFADYKSGELSNPEMTNPFAYWLNEKLDYHRLRNELARPEELAEQSLPGHTK